MKELAYYHGLPDYMPGGELLAEFLRMVECYEIGRCDKRIFLEALLALADRQWHTYVVLRNDVRVRIESILIGLWDGNNLAAAENILVLCGRLGLQDLYVFCRTQKEKGVSPEIEEEIVSAILEFGDSVADPYVGLRQ
ncbi:hypothetical protein [Pseudomonas viridiflava]|uniref:hypothetical protein n=1 Tax=Pseudomonas viridiflava TaxID=33069 RepID=UPI0020BD79AC|nr:hypothetical protein [Pseudomonas viridiflava]